MKISFNTISKSIFIFSIITILLSVIFFTIGRMIPIEITNHNIKDDVLFFIMAVSLASIILTLFGTLSKDQSATKKITVVLITLAITILVEWGYVQLIYRYYWGRWISTEILYRNTIDNATIQLQIHDEGGFGYGDYRVVKIKPLTKYFSLITMIDTAQIEKKNWKRVNESVGEIKIP